ncbi:MAG TPA: hypothetical protein VM509_15290 [Planctomycetota bacterium]|nr:hypothetical protein [Planctomycetota bacterium]
MILRLLACSMLVAFQTPPKPAEPAPQTPAPEKVPLMLEKITRLAPDGVTLTADFCALPLGGEDRPTFVSFHMENGSRGEFAQIAQRFGEYACCTLAVDLRTGKATDGVANETAASAASVLKKTSFTNEEAFADVVEGLKWAREMRPNGKVFALGSGTSAALVVAAVGRNPTLADAVFLFSPGEDVAGWSIATEAKAIKVPTYLTCGGTVQEAGRARPIGHAIEKKLCRMVIPLNVPSAARGSAVLVQTDPAWLERHWSTIISMILKLAPLTPQGPTEAPTKKV